MTERMRLELARRSLLIEHVLWYGEAACPLRRCPICAHNPIEEIA